MLAIKCFQMTKQSLKTCVTFLHSTEGLRKSETIFKYYGLWAYLTWIEVKANVSNLNFFKIKASINCKIICIQIIFFCVKDILCIQVVTETQYCGNQFVVKNFMSC